MNFFNKFLWTGWIGLIAMGSASAEELIPFSLPWNDNRIQAPSVLTLKDRPAPAGVNGFVHVENGHFVDRQGKRVRFLGVNLAFAGNYPTHQQADLLATRMAKYGINCVRFHHTDTNYAPNGIWKADAPNKQTLDPTMLDRMDYFINQLKQNGIYADINLKIGREVIDSDGFTEVNRLPTYDKGPDHYFPRMIELQKNYARDLLTHQNPYTGNRYVDEPAVAIVEIVNESGLVSQWGNSSLDEIPAQYIEPLQQDWNLFLRTKYSNTDTLRKAWTPTMTGNGEELLRSGLSGFVFQQISPGQGKQQIVTEGENQENAVRLDVTSLDDLSWHVQTTYHKIPVKKGGFYKVSFALRADPARTVTVGLGMDHDPWDSLDDSVSLNLTKEWKTFTVQFTSKQDEENARLYITGLANQLGTLWFNSPSMIESSPQGMTEGESLEEGNVSWISRASFSGYAAAARQDWIEFLVDRESQYYREMNQYLKNDLHLQSMIAGTQLGFGTVLSQLENDFIDIHGYWNHPVFPHASWDSEDWYVNNESMVDAQGNTLERLMLSRVDGRAFTCTEYNHPAPMTYSSETLPLLAAYAAFQDWDGIFIYAYSHTNNYASESISNFFDINGHTPKMLAMPAAYNFFVRGDIAPAKQKVTANLSPGEYRNWLLERSGSQWFTPLLLLGIDGAAPYQHQTTFQITNDTSAVKNPAYETIRHNMASDTGELIWNQVPGRRARLEIHAPKSKGVVGFIQDASCDLGDGIQLTIGQTRQGWANVLLTYLDTDEEGHKWLLTATGYHENQGMVWKNDEKNSVGKNWGSGPALVEPVPLKLSITSSTDITSKQSVKIFPLDNLSQPGEELPKVVSRSEAGLMIDLMDSPSALWYELVFKKEASVDHSTRY